uniref:Uncharacterized protein n=1 Tax=Iridovirus sp. TaxID=135728 RepID=A0AAU7YE46_9VIRU
MLYYCYFHLKIILLHNSIQVKRILSMINLLLCNQFVSIPKSIYQDFDEQLYQLHIYYH